MSRASRLCQCPKRCGGTLVQRSVKFGATHRPKFSCIKCSYSFTDGKDGGVYAAVVPADTRVMP